MLPKTVRKDTTCMMKNRVPAPLGNVAQPAGGRMVPRRPASAPQARSSSRGRTHRKGATRPSSAGHRRPPTLAIPSSRPSSAPPRFRLGRILEHPQQQPQQAPQQAAAAPEAGPASDTPPVTPPTDAPLTMWSAELKQYVTAPPTAMPTVTPDTVAAPIGGAGGVHLLFQATEVQQEPGIPPESAAEVEAGAGKVSARPRSAPAGRYREGTAAAIKGQSSRRPRSAKAEPGNPRRLGALQQQHGQPEPDLVQKVKSSKHGRVKHGRQDGSGGSNDQLSAQLNQVVVQRKQPATAPLPDPQLQMQQQPPPLPPPQSTPQSTPKHGSQQPAPLPGHEPAVATPTNGSSNGAPSVSTPSVPTVDMRSHSAQPAGDADGSSPPKTPTAEELPMTSSGSAIIGGISSLRKLRQAAPTPIATPTAAGQASAESMVTPVQPAANFDSAVDAVMADILAANPTLGPSDDSHTLSSTGSTESSGRRAGTGVHLTLEEWSKPVALSEVAPGPARRQETSEERQELLDAAGGMRQMMDTVENSWRAKYEELAAQSLLRGTEVQELATELTAVKQAAKAAKERNWARVAEAEAREKVAMERLAAAVKELEGSRQATDRRPETPAGKLFCRSCQDTEERLAADKQELEKEVEERTAERAAAKSAMESLQQLQRGTLDRLAAAEGIAAGERDATVQEAKLRRTCSADLTAQVQAALARAAEAEADRDELDAQLQEVATQAEEDRQAAASLLADRQARAAAMSSSQHRRILELSALVKAAEGKLAEHVDKQAKLTIGGQQADQLRLQAEHQADVLREQLQRQQEREQDAEQEARRQADQAGRVEQDRLQLQLHQERQQVLEQEVARLAADKGQAAEALAGAVAAVDSRCGELQRRLTDAEGSLQHVLGSQSSLEPKLAHLQQIAAVTDSRVTAVQGQADQLQSVVGELSVAVTAASGKAEEAVGRIGALRAAQVEGAAEWAGRHAALAADCTKGKGFLAHQLGGLEEAVSELDDAVAGGEEDVAGLHAHVAALQSTCLVQRQQTVDELERLSTQALSAAARAEATQSVDEQGRPKTPPPVESELGLKLASRIAPSSASPRRQSEKRSQQAEAKTLAQPAVLFEPAALSSLAGPVGQQSRRKSRVRGKNGTMRGALQQLQAELTKMQQVNPSSAAGGKENAPAAGADGGALALQQSPTKPSRREAAAPADGGWGLELLDWSNSKEQLKHDVGAARPVSPSLLKRAATSGRQRAKLSSREAELTSPEFTTLSLR